MDAREDAGYPRRGNVFDGFGVAGVFRTPRRQRRPGSVTHLDLDRICIWGPDSFGKLRKRCFELTNETWLDESLDLGTFVTVLYRGSIALRVEISQG